ncbi:feruloyl esterase B [Thozetella sp. PMI_491]|nr:feruloyl esterase B [Thozetella sp. PMI_491]
MRAHTVAILAAATLGESAVGLSSGNCSAATFVHALPSNAVIENVTAVAQNGSFGEGASNLGYPAIPTSLPQLCAVIVKVTSSPSSSFRFGLLLPAEWNSRFLEIGNGGFAGGINWNDAATGARYGFATASTDTGHNATAEDGSWALNAPEKLIDWGWRAIHGTAAIAKDMANAYYSSPVQYAYYSGCSTGGRQGLREAQLYPDTFDGLLVGAPAWWTSHLQPWTTWTGALNLPINGTNHFDVSLLTALATEIVKQCDSADGVKDGIISAPDLCEFNYAALDCSTPGANASACFTAAQLETVKALHAPYIVDGKLAMAPLKKGSERQWSIQIGGQEPSGLGIGYERYFLFNDPSYKWEQYNDSVIGIADQVQPGNATAYAFDMSAVRDHGAKIIMYHGLADGFIPTGSSEHFYEAVANATGGITSLRDWFRFFFIPGMGHCSSTSVGAPWYIGSASQASTFTTRPVHSVPGFQDRKHDALLALMSWVENGTVVDSLVATVWKNQTNPDSGVLRQRPLCPYPETSKWDRTGNIDEATSWACTA